MAMKTDPTKYAEIPAGTTFEYTELNPEGTAITGTLYNLRSTGVLGDNRNYVDCTTLYDQSTKTIQGIKELLDVSWSFIDAKDETEFDNFLKLADGDNECQVVITFPNGRVFTGKYYLSGFQMEEPDSAAPIAITVNARQYDASWNLTT